MSNLSEKNSYTSYVEEDLFSLKKLNKYLSSKLFKIINDFHEDINQVKLLKASNKTRQLLTDSLVAYYSERVKERIFKSIDYEYSTVANTDVIRNLRHLFELIPCYFYSFSKHIKKAFF